MFFGSFSYEKNLSEREGWVETTAVVTDVELPTYENFNEEAISRHEEPRWWGEEHVSYEFNREDGSVGTGTWWRRGLDTRDNAVFTSVDDKIDIVYDPNSAASAQGHLPETANYIGAYVIRVLGAVLSAAAICVCFVTRKKHETVV